VLPKARIRGLRLSYDPPIGAGGFELQKRLKA
jgi:hypothetical protein